MYGSKFRLDNDSDWTYHPSEGFTSPPPVRSGFDVVQSAGSDTMVAPLPVSRAHVKFAGRVVSPPLPPCVPSHAPHQGNALTVFVARSISPVDTAMLLDDGRNTNATGLGDSQHAVLESSLPSQGLERSPPLVSLPPMASSVNLDMMDALDDIAAGRSSPMSDGSSTDDNVPVPFLRGRKDVDYDNLGQVAGDIQALADGYEAVRSLLERILGEKLVLEECVERQGRWITDLEEQVDEMRRGEFAFPPPLFNGNKQAARAPVPGAPKRTPAGPAKPVVPVTPARSEVSSRPRGPPPVPSQTRPVAVAGPAACAAGTWVDVVKRKAPRGLKPAPVAKPSPTARAPPSASPSPITTRERHITLRFATRKTVVLPAGVSAETVRTQMNAYLANQPKVGGSSPYIKEARLRADVGCIYATLTAHSFGQIEGMLAGCHTVLVRDLGLPDFVFARDTAKIKVLVIGVPLADTGRGSIWRVEDWTNDKVYDGLRLDVERSNPGMFTAGRPNILGSIHAMKENKATTCQIRLILEKTPEVDGALRTGKMFLRGANRGIRLWTDHRPAQVCHNCMQLGHISTMCAAPPRCRLCRGSHRTAQHLCPALNCPGGQGEACEHTVHICMLCESSGHYTGYDRCPALRATPEAAPPRAQGSPLAGDAGSVSGIADRNRNRFNTRSRNRRRPTPPGEMAVDNADAALLREAKGKAPASSDTKAAAPAPKSILRRTSSDPNLPPSSGLTG